MSELVLKIMVNAVPLKAGGGLRLGREFMRVALEPPSGYSLDVHPSRALANEYFPVRARSLRDVILHARRSHPDVLLTLFGPGLPFVPMPQVVGMAYSNLLYPAGFRSDLPFKPRLFAQVRDVARKVSLHFPTGLFFESEGLRAKAVETLGLIPELTDVVLPSRPSWELPAKTAGSDFRVRLLYVGSSNPNKGYHALPRVIAYLRSLEGDRARFEVDMTLELSDPLVTPLVQASRELDVLDRFNFLGRLDEEDLVSAYQRADFVILLSRLESFSNTVLEAWAAGRPLVCADESWARDSCADAAEYVPRSEPEIAAEAIFALSKSKRAQRALTERGRIRLRNYPASGERAQQVLQFAARVREAT